MQRAKSLTSVHQDVLTSPSQAYYILDEILISGELQVASLSWGTISSPTSLTFFLWGGTLTWQSCNDNDSSGWDSLCEESSKRAVLHHISEQEQIAAVLIGGKRNVLAVPSQVKNGQRLTNVVIFFYIFLWKSKVWKQDQTSRFMPRLQTHKQE